MNSNYLQQLKFIPHDNQRLASLCGQQNEHLRQLEKSLNVVIKQRGNIFQVSGDESEVAKAYDILNRLYEDTETLKLSSEQVHLRLREAKIADPKKSEPTSSLVHEAVIIHIKNLTIQGHTTNQKAYLANIRKFDINFSIGPAGTGKTYLAVASAVDALESGKVKRVLLVRPAVEAGEKLGFLPGTLEDKISPYLRPLYDALFEMLGFERINKLISQNIIEVAPLAYMRGRTLNDSFIILDESQNTTTEQMKMFLTRIGFNSKVIVTGDITQIDLPKGRKSGLIQAIEVLKDIEGICFTHFGSRDVVRHPLVQRVIEAYEIFDKDQETKFEDKSDVLD